MDSLIIGLMSGTSVDGVDAALVRLAGSGRGIEAELVALSTHPFPEGLRQEVFNLCHGKGNAERVSRLNVALGHLFADAAQSVWQPGVTAIASHGQTVSHAPPATLQIGDPAVIAMRLGVPVVSHFRSADLAHGGQGAPLVPYADWCLLTHATQSRAVQNIGGIGNVTYLPADAAPESVLGFDTGPGNMLIDAAIRHSTNGEKHHDAEGALAALGTIQQTLLAQLLAHPFLSLAPPKSAGREQFGEAFFRTLPELSTPDLLATLTAFTAQSITEAYRRFLPQMPEQVIVGGGGARNPTLMRMLTEALSPIPVLTHESIGMNGDGKEALAFALLAHETLQGVPSNLPSVTGASRRVLLGSITTP